MASDLRQPGAEPDEAMTTMPRGYVAEQRNRFFTGKFITARDLTDEQHYHLSRHWLHNRLLHGYGVVCGLGVKRHYREACRERFVIVRPGIAIDCFGRELVLRAETPVELPPRADMPAAAAAAPSPRRLVVVMRYLERHAEPTQALCSDDRYDPSHEEANRIHEGVALKAVELEEFADYPNEWPGTLLARARPGEGADPGEPSFGPCRVTKATAPCYDDSDFDLPGPVGVCLEPDGRIGGLLPIAVLTEQPGNAEKPWRIETCGRRQMTPPPEELTHIVGHNWRHGEKMSLADLRAMDNKLTIEFDRPVQVADGSGRGISPFTFSVTYEGRPQRTIEFLPDDPRHPARLSADGRVAEFTIAEWYTSPNIHGPTLPVGTNIYISLKCNFLLDLRGLPVDGDYLCGVLPTGDGVPGGAFESWFQIKADEE